MVDTLMIYQVKEGWEVRKGDRVVELFPISPFETHESCGAIIDAIEYIRKAEKHGAYFDFSVRIVKNKRVRRG